MTLMSEVRAPRTTTGGDGCAASSPVVHSLSERSGRTDSSAAAATGVRALLCHPGTQHSFRLAEQLARLGLLSRFCSSVVLRRESVVYRAAMRLSPARTRGAICNRTLSGVRGQLIAQSPHLELRYLLARYAGRPDEEAFHAKAESFQAGINRRAILTATHIIGFDGASWDLALRAATLGRTFVLDRTAVHHRTHAAVMDLIASRYGARWLVDVKPAGVRDVEERELAAAGRIVVASRFSRDSLVSAGIEPSRIDVNAYGVDSTLFNPGGRLVGPSRRRPIRFLFVGALTAFKGLPVLLDAFRALPKGSATLSLVGRASPQLVSLMPREPGFEILGQRARGEVSELMRSHDVLVFPSLLDGFGLVLLEAMACGMPVIATFSCAGPDLVTDGEHGFVVQSANAAALSGRMRAFVDHPDVIPAMSSAARARAERFTWNKYGDRWAATLAAAVTT